MATTEHDAGPVLDDGGVTFHLSDPTGRLATVRLVQEVGLTRGLDFDRRDGDWRLRLTQPAVDRMEYLLEIVDHNGRLATITDPGNPLRATGAFGDKSVVEFRSYRPPEWLSQPRVTESTRPLSIDTHAHATIAGWLWSPEGLTDGEPAPMIIVHDGPEYAQLGSFTQYLAALIAAGRLPPVRAALLAPGERNSWYSADPAYANALCTEVVPELARLAPTTVRIGVGVSLGALAMLHAHCSYPGTFSGLLLQSGSFFTPTLDPQERSFSGFEAVTGFVAAVERDGATTSPVPTAITCGTVEENRPNNEKMASTLAALGYRVELRECPDAHNYTAWRDGLDPALTTLVTSVVGSHAT